MHLLVLLAAALVLGAALPRLLAATHRVRLPAGVRLLGLAGLVVLASAAPALADTGEASYALDILNPAVYVPLIGGVVIPFAVATLTKLNSQLWVKSLVAFVSAGLVAGGVYLTDTGGASTWAGFLNAFTLALVAAVASRVAITGGADTRLAIRTEGFGFGRAA